MKFAQNLSGGQTKLHKQWEVQRNEKNFSGFGE